jgi:excisionase family DNA binding protein
MSDLLDDGLMTIDQACEFLAVSRTTIWQLMKNGSLPYTHVAPRARRIPRAAVKALAAKNLSL